MIIEKLKANVEREIIASLIPETIFKCKKL